MITRVIASPLINKRYRVFMDNGNSWDFGFKDPKSGRYGSTYIDNHSGTLRAAYRKRHLGNATEKRLIENLVPSAALFSYMLLWGDHQTLAANVKALNAMWASKHKQ